MRTAQHAQRQSVQGDDPRWVGGIPTSADFPIITAISPAARWPRSHLALPVRFLIFDLPSVLRNPKTPSAIRPLAPCLLRIRKPGSARNSHFSPAASTAAPKVPPFLASDGSVKSPHDSFVQIAYQRSITAPHPHGQLRRDLFYRQCWRRWRRRSAKVFSFEAQD